MSSFFKPKGFRGKKAVTPDWFSMQWLLGCCVSYVLLCSANKYRPPLSYISYEKILWKIIDIYFSVMHVFYIFCLDLFVVFDQRPSMLPIVTNFVVIVDYQHQSLCFGK